MVQMMTMCKAVVGTITECSNLFLEFFFKPVLMSLVLLYNVESSQHDKTPEQVQVAI